VRKIGFITTNHVLAQSLAALLKNKKHLGFEPFLLLDPCQALLDAEVVKIDVAVVDVMEWDSKEIEAIWSFCRSLRHMPTGCRLMLLVPQKDKMRREMAIEAMKKNVVDDYVFYDTSLEYLFAKLAAI
jgi:hypothetical protein